MTGAVARGGGGGLVLEPSGDRLDVQRVFAVPRIVGPALDGLAADEEGFIVAGDDGRVEGTERTWAAGDGIVSPIKFGGLATHQARVVAAGIARVAGVDDVPDPGEPVLHGRLLVGHRTRRLRGRGDAEGAPLWWPQGKIAGEYLPRWLSEHGVAPPGGVPAPEGREHHRRALDARAPCPGAPVPVRARPPVPDRRPGRGIARPADARGSLRMTATGTPLDTEMLRRIDAAWRAANYLSVGQIYLLDNPLLREPLRPEHVKPRLLGHWGTTPGLNLLYVHMNRVIRERDLETLFVTGPGHGGPGLVASTWLEGTYSEIYPEITRDEEGMRRLFRQFSFPGGIPSHVAPETPGSIHEGGELGYALTHAYGAAFDNPDLVVLCVVGDGEAETGPLATSWHSNKFLDPVHDGAVLPVLHLNGFKIANPTVLARIPRDELAALLEGYGHRPIFVEGDDPEDVHRQMAAALDDALDDIAAIQHRARVAGERDRPRWPMLVLRTPKGWTGPAEGTPASHQVPLSHLRERPEALAQLEAWMRSYRPEELFDDDGVPRDDVLAPAPEGERRMGAVPQANGGLLRQDLRLPDFRDYAVDVPEPARTTQRGDARPGDLLARRDRPQPPDVPALRT